jgi:hypothetical protein
VLISVGQDIGFYDGELGLDAASYKTLQAEGIERKKAAEAEAAARKAAAPIDHAHGAMNLAVAEGANVTEEERAVLSELTYVEFQLLDDESIAIPNEFFDLVLADGSSRNGQLDKKGFVRIDGVVRGRCQIKFSRLGYIKVL